MSAKGELLSRYMRSNLLIAHIRSETETVRRAMVDAIEGRSSMEAASAQAVRVSRWLLRVV